jgi:hypothetical protein
MSLRDFVAGVTGFAELSHTDKIELFGWYLHTNDGRDRFDQSSVRQSYDELHLVPPDLSTYFKRMVERRPPLLLKDSRGYRLEGNVRRRLDLKFAVHPTIVAVSRLLSDLPKRVPGSAERAFLDEAVSCYRVGAFRASIVMAWNLAFDHLLRWIVADPVRLAKFNSNITVRFPKRLGLTMSRLEDFEEFKESEIIEICKTAHLFSKDVGKVLTEKLNRRNTAAHPSLITITQHQADDTITDLVNNVVSTLL